MWNSIVDLQDLKGSTLQLPVQENPMALRRPIKVQWSTVSVGGRVRRPSDYRQREAAVSHFKFVSI